MEIVCVSFSITSRSWLWVFVVVCQDIKFKAGIVLAVRPQPPIDTKDLMNSCKTRHNQSCFKLILEKGKQETESSRDAILNYDLSLLLFPHLFPSNKKRLLDFYYVEKEKLLSEPTESFLTKHQKWPTSQAASRKNLPVLSAKKVVLWLTFEETRRY